MRIQLSGVEQARRVYTCLDRLAEAVNKLRTCFENFEDSLHRERVGRPIDGGIPGRYNALRKKANLEEALDYLHREGEYIIHHSNDLYQRVVPTYPKKTGPEFKKCLNKMREELSSTRKFIEHLKN